MRPLHYFENLEALDLSYNRLARLRSLAAQIICQKHARLLYYPTPPPFARFPLHVPRGTRSHVTHPSSEASPLFIMHDIWGHRVAASSIASVSTT